MLAGPEAYEFTALAARAVLSRLASGHAPKGFHTPVTAYGTTVIEDIPRDQHHRHRATYLIPELRTVSVGATSRRRRTGWSTVVGSATIDD